MHADSRRELHEITHRRIYKSGTSWNEHIDISISNHGSATAIDDLPVDSGSMIQIFVGDSIGASWRKMSVATRTDRRLHHRPPVGKQVRLLITKIDLHGVLSQRSPGGENRKNSHQK